MENSIRYTNYDKNGKGNYIQNSPTSCVAQQTDDVLSGEFGTPDVIAQGLYGLDERGIWKQAHQILYSKNGYCDPRFVGVGAEDVYNDIVIALLEITVEQPDIIEKGTGYLLVAASNRVRNKYAKLYQQYYVKKGYTTTSLDVVHENIDEDNFDEHADFIQQITFTYDYETAVTVKDIIAGLDDTGKQVAAYLQDGYKASEIARLTGMYPMQVSRIVKNLRTQLADVLL